MSAQHEMIKQDLSDAQTAIQTDIAEVKALLEALNAPPCGAGTEGQRFVPDTTEVCDNTTGLFWALTPEIPLSQPAALSHCADLDLGNGQTYRLPEVNELSSLVDYTQFNPALPEFHPFGEMGTESAAVGRRQRLPLILQKRGWWVSKVGTREPQIRQTTNFFGVCGVARDVAVC